MIRLSGSREKYASGPPRTTAVMPGSPLLAIAPRSSARLIAILSSEIAGLPPAARKELDDLFSLLAFAPTRCLIAGIWTPWPEASRDSVAAFLDAWRDSRFALLRSAYGALHQVVLGAWYGKPQAWPAIWPATKRLFIHEALTCF